MRDGKIADPVFVVLDIRGAALARRLKINFSNAEVHGLGVRAPGGDRVFDKTADHLKKLFMDGRPIVGVMAAGI